MTTNDLQNAERVLSYYKERILDQLTYVNDSIYVIARHQSDTYNEALQSLVSDGKVTYRGKMMGADEYRMA